MSRRNRARGGARFLGALFLVWDEDARAAAGWGRELAAVEPTRPRPLAAAIGAPPALATRPRGRALARRASRT